MFTLSDIRALAKLAQEAGALILRIRAEHLSKVKDWGHAAKADGSPVTRADREAEAHIVAGIEKLGLKAPVVAEESADFSALNGAEGFYLIDPLDGTRAFVNGGEDFCVNIGFAAKGRAVAGVIYVPMAGETYTTEGQTAWFEAAGGEAQKISARAPGVEGLDVIVNRTEDWSGRLKRYLETQKLRGVKRLSSAHKLGLVARGAYDVYPRFGKSYEWDTCAGDAILRAAGGTLCTLDGVDMAYGKADFLNPPFIARGK